MRWASVAGWTSYSVSDTGLVRSEVRTARHPSGGEKRIRSRMLVRCANDAGYLFVTFSREGKTLTRAVHVLVLEAFIGPCPAGMECRHLDGDKGNVALTNLCWGTPGENGQDRRRHGTQPRGERHGAAKLSAAAARAAAKDRRSQQAIAADLNVSQTTISDIKRGRHWAVRQQENQL